MITERVTTAKLLAREQVVTTWSLQLAFNVDGLLEHKKITRPIKQYGHVHRFERLIF